MHLFRWARFLSWKRRRSSITRRSSHWLLRHFHRDRDGSMRSSMVGGAPSSSSLSVSANFDLRPSMIYIDHMSESSTAPRRSSETRRSKKQRSSIPSSIVDSVVDEDRQFIEDFHRQHGQPEAHPSSVTLARVSSIFTPARRSTIMERASIVKLFNQLQFEMPPPPLEPPPPDDAVWSDPVTTSPPLSAKKARAKKRKMKSANQAGDAVLPAEAELHTEPSFFRQYLLRTKSKLTAPEEPKLRPLSAAQCHAYIHSQSVTLDSVGKPLTAGSRWEEPEPEPMQFLFFGGSSEENLHHLHEVDTEPRRYLARFAAGQPPPSCTTSIHIKPTLVRGLPPVFEPTFHCVYI